MYAGFDPDVPIESAWTPPARWYVDREVHEDERRRVWAKTWQVVGRRDQLTRPGSYFAGTFMDEGYVVVRGEDGKIRAFFNTCRHHAAQVATGESCATKFVCPYHGWTYALDGTLKSAPRMGAVRDFERDAFGLVPMSVAIWGPLVAIKLQKATTPDHDPIHAPELEAALVATQWSELRFFARRVYEVACNWKVYVDNYLDGGYHVNVLHGDLASQLDLDSYRTQIHTNSVVQSCRGGTGEPKGLDFRERLGDGAVYGWLYPNFMINRYGPLMDTNLVIPVDENRCRVIFDYFCDPSLATDQDFLERSLNASETVQREDEEICASVQSGLRSAAYDRGRYAPKLEAGAHHFHRLLAADLSPES